MQRKQNETELGRMMRDYGFYAKKARDRGYLSCPNCHIPVKTCPHCKKDLLLNKAETLPDFIIAMDYVYVEGKGSTDSWNWKSSITEIQDRVCLEHESWLFLEMGTGRAPKGRSAWLVPWVTWKEIQTNLEALGFSSIIFEGTTRTKNPVAKDVLQGYECEWHNGGWKLPVNHPFWKARYIEVALKAQQFYDKETDDGSRPFFDLAAYQS